MEEKYAYLAVAVIIVVLVFGYYNMWFEQWGIAPVTEPVVPTLVPTPTPTPTGIPVGTYTFKDVAYNSLDISAALTLGTDVDQSFYAYRGGWVLLGAHGASGTDIEITTGDNGYVYVLCQRHSTATYIFDAAKSLAMNVRAVGIQFLDVTGDTVKEFMVKWSMHNIPAAASGYPSCTFTGYYYDDDSASAAYPSGGQAADQTDIGETKVTKYLPWYFGFSAEKHAVAVYKIEVKVNTTSSSKAELLSVNIPSIGLVSASSFDYQKTDTYQTWTYTCGTDLGDCLYWELPANHNNKFDTTTSIQLTLATNDELVWTQTIYQISAGQTTVTDADSATTQEAA